MTMRTAPVQGEGIIGGGRERLPAGKVPWRVYELAMREYNRHHDQTPERLAERGGLGWSELIAAIRGDYSSAGVRKAQHDLAGLETPE